MYHQHEIGEEMDFVVCVIDGKNREITKKLVQPVPPHPCWKQWEFQWENDQKNKMAQNHFFGVQNGSQSV